MDDKEMSAKDMSSGDPRNSGFRNNPFEALRKLRPASEEPPTPTPTAPSEENKAASPTEVHERVTVRRERAGRGGKTVTVAEGPGLAAQDLDPLAREAARALGVGARVERGAIVLQGDQSARLSEWLTRRGFRRVSRGN